MLKISLFGHPNLSINDKLISHAPTKSVFALLAYLAEESETGLPHSREKLAELLWPGIRPESGRKNLRQALYELNKILPENSETPILLTSRESLQWNSEISAQIDTHTFEQSLLTPTPENLKQAVASYRGDFLEGFYLSDSADFEDWAQNRREYYRRRYRETLHTLTEIDPAQAERYTRRLLESNPLDERAVRKLMTVLAENGARTQALQQYEQFRQLLSDELGVDPQAETITLYEQIVQDKLEPKPAAAPHVPEPRTPSRLPTLLTPFIGRHTEIEMIKDLLQSPTDRLLTLVGPGGVGKTRLAIQVASEMTGSFSDGVHFVPLAPVQSAEGILPAISRALGLSFSQEEESPEQQLYCYLENKQMLLILDNFEHLLEGSNLATEILTSSQTIKLFVTTRQRLNLQGEKLYPVAGMTTPDIEEASLWNTPQEQARSFNAVQLFCNRAQRIRPDFALTKENIQPVVEICSLVQGIPLGIELAASWLELLSPAEIAAEIRRSLDFLETDLSDVPDRQRSLRSVFESSWKLLNEQEQQTFLRLCVFVGSFSRKAAEQVSGGSLRTLLGLANKSWLLQREDQRFELHELMRQYGEERLRNDQQAWRDAKDRHAAYFAEFVTQQSHFLRSKEQLRGVIAIAEEHESNIKSAWDWLVAEQRWQELIEIWAIPIFHYNLIRMDIFDLIPWLRTARLELENYANREEQLYFAMFSSLEIFCGEGAAFTREDDPVERLKELWQMVEQDQLAEEMGFYFALLAGLVDAHVPEIDVDQQIAASIKLLREQNNPWQLALGLLIQGQWVDSFNYNENALVEAAEIFNTLGGNFEQGIVAEELGLLAFRERRPNDEIIAHFVQARQYFQQLAGYSLVSGMNLGTLAETYIHQGKYEQGFALFEEDKRDSERYGRTRNLLRILEFESLLAARYSSYEHSLRVRQQHLDLARRLKAQITAAWGIFELGETHRIFGELEKAVEMYEQARQEFIRLDNPLGYYYRAQGDLALHAGKHDTALAYYNDFFSDMDEYNHVWSIAQARGKTGLVLAIQGNTNAARDHFQKGLKQAVKLHLDDLALQILLAAPACLLHEKNYQKALELAAFIAIHPASWVETKRQARELMESAAVQLQTEKAQAAEERGKSLVFEDVMREIIGDF